MRYSFYMVYCDPTTYDSPNLHFINAETINDAIRLFCSQQPFTLVESAPTKDSRIEIWVEFPDRKMARYLVTES